MTRAVHQVLPVYSWGDAIGGAVQRTQQILRALGFRSETFAQVHDPRLQARPAAELPEAAAADDAVVYHLSIGSPVADLFAQCQARKVIVYHGITPAEYYAATSAEVTYWLERGREELRRLVAAADLVIADSKHNLDECAPFGPRRAAVIPPPVDLERLRPRPAVPERPPRILFVGRTAPNKRHDTLLRALAALRATAISDARLHVVGSSFDTGTYLRRLRDLAERLGVDQALDMTGEHAGDAEVADAYARASIFACASAHEGFCVPLVEAMAFHVPIVALSRTAVPDTLDGAALLLDDRDPLIWAGALARGVLDHGLRAELIARGRRRLDDFAESAIAQRLSAALTEAGITP